MLSDKELNKEVRGFLKNEFKDLKFKVAANPYYISIDLVEIKSNSEKYTFKSDFLNKLNNKMADISWENAIGKETSKAQNVKQKLLTNELIYLNQEFLNVLEKIKEFTAKFNDTNENTDIIFKTAIDGKIELNEKFINNHNIKAA